MTDRDIMELILQKVTSMETKITSLDTRLSSVETKLASLDTRLSSVEKDIALIKTEQEQIKLAVLETNESVKRLETIQESQNRIIELLSARSLQQEAELKRIKEYC